MKRFLIIFPLITLTACAGAVPWNKQNYAGLSQWKVESCDPATGICVKGSFTDGKESEEKQLAIQLADIIIKYSTAGERAFEGFKTRADVEAASIKEFGKIVPGFVDAIMKEKGISP